MSRNLTFKSKGDIRKATPQEDGSLSYTKGKTPITSWTVAPSDGKLWETCPTRNNIFFDNLVTGGDRAFEQECRTNKITIHFKASGKKDEHWFFLSLQRFFVLCSLFLLLHVIFSPPTVWDGLAPLCEFSVLLLRFIFSPPAVTVGWTQMASMNGGWQWNVRVPITCMSLLATVLSVLSYQWKTSFVLYARFAP